MPRGGPRAGAGRKPKTARERALDGNVGHRGRILPHPSVPEAPTAPAEIEEFDAPDELTMDERHVWMELAPHAFRNRTLTKGTSLAFRLLCQNIVLLRRYALSVNDAGGANHRGMIQRVQADLSVFSVRPCGKPMYEAEPVKPANPLERFVNRNRG